MMMMAIILLVRRLCERGIVVTTFLLSYGHLYYYITFHLLGVVQCFPISIKRCYHRQHQQPHFRSVVIVQQRTRIRIRKVAFYVPNYENKILGLEVYPGITSQQDFDENVKKSVHNNFVNRNNTNKDGINSTGLPSSEELLLNATTTTCHNTNNIIAAGRDRKLPDLTALPIYLQDSEVLMKLIAIYHAIAHTTTLHILKEFWNTYNGVVLQSQDRGNNKTNRYDYYNQSRRINISQKKHQQHYYCNEEDLTRSLQTSLKDAGFVLLSKRDWDLCEALNAGYLLRLTIQPDFKNLDPDLGSLFYPNNNNNNNNNNNKEQRQNLRYTISTSGPRARRQSNYNNYTQDNSSSSSSSSGNSEPLLFNGQVLVFRRGYSAEVTEGLLLLPKIDYIQTSVVQRSTAAVIQVCISVLSSIVSFLRTIATKIESTIIAMRPSLQHSIIDEAYLLLQKLARFQSNAITAYNSNHTIFKSKSENRTVNKNDGGIAGGIAGSLSRYGGHRGSIDTSYNNANVFDRNYALAPFLALDGTEGRHNNIICKYDLMKNTTPPLRLIERISISDLVEGRIFKSFTTKSQLVEPTYDEVVVIWRPLSRKTALRAKMAMKIKKFAELFDLEDSLPSLPFTQQQEAAVPGSSVRDKKLPIEIRIFKGVQMSNLPAVFPQTKLIFRPADAFVNDLITVLTFAAALASLKFESTKYDVIALVSFFTWLTRTFFRYRNTIARYDLLVKKFVTSKLTFRGSGALKYVVTQAGQQRAIRAGLFYYWILNHLASSSSQTNGAESMAIPLDGQNMISESDMLLYANEGINEMLGETVDIDVVTAIHDLEDMKIIKRSSRHIDYFVVQSSSTALASLRERWIELFDSY